MLPNISCDCACPFSAAFFNHSRCFMLSLLGPLPSRYIREIWYIALTLPPSADLWNHSRASVLSSLFHAVFIRRSPYSKQSWGLSDSSSLLKSSAISFPMSDFSLVSNLDNFARASRLPFRAALMYRSSALSRSSAFTPEMIISARFTFASSLSRFTASSNQ
ncbi:hypothetical protein SDC9_130242 [bioreactor metagenome]|uniref:Uncharacterized protein n=1 Tax=bioreactor metagenome TaxID=1076179 RepID=A0A645D1V1_9ZZZZ